MNPGHFPTISAVEANLNGITLVARDMLWEHEGPPANDILAARLRAKYYGAQVITYRPFLLKILERSSDTSKSSSEQISNEQFKGEIRDVPSVNKHATRLEEFDPKAVEYALSAIRALIRSTTAFHGLMDEECKPRLIVTNVWGTAHAYASLSDCLPPFP